VNPLKRLAWAATAVAALTSPIIVVWFMNHGHSLVVSVIFAVLFVGAFRGAVDLALKHLVEQVPLTLDAAKDDMAEDALRRRRLHFWRGKFRLLGILSLLITVVWLIHGGSWLGTWGYTWDAIASKLNGQMIQQLIILPIFFLANFLLFFGPMMMMGISQMSGLEPGDADFGVELDDVRGQAEAKEEIRKVVTLWQSGAKFTKAGGKRERGILFLGPPGTGKTMLAKAIATGFNSPIVLMPGSGFAQTFIGMDVIIVRYMARKAKKLARKWGGQCIIFIDEIDAVGMRRAALQGGAGGSSKTLDPQIPGGGGMFGGMGQMGLQSLLVVMDGIDNPPFLRKTLVSKVNLWLDALYIVPQKIRVGWRTSDKYPTDLSPRYISLRLPKAKPTGNQIFFVGATNVPLEALDPAMTRPGRMGRHIYFRTPTKRDRLDIFDLYLGKVTHDADLDTTEAREELARVTDNYSPAQIEQVCSIALTYAHHSGREAFSRADLLEAMVTVEAGTALGWGYESEEEERSTAIHEAGHAVCEYLYQEHTEAVRLSIKKRGATGGHLMSVENVERFALYRDELMDRLVTILGAYAAEVEFYGNNTQGVGGDLGQASYLAGAMVGRWGMDVPEYPGCDHKAMEKIGQRLVAAAGPYDIKLAPYKTKAECTLLGIAYTVARNAVQENRLGIEKIVATLLREKEVYGDDLTRLMDSAGLQAPERIDWSIVG